MTAPEGRPGWCLAVGRPDPHYVAEVLPNADGIALCATCRLRMERQRGGHRG